MSAPFTIPLLSLPLSFNLSLPLSLSISLFLSLPLSPFLSLPLSLSFILSACLPLTKDPDQTLAFHGCVRGDKASLGDCGHTIRTDREDK